MPVKRSPGQSFNVAERLDPYFLYELYGADQFRGVLSCFGVPRLQEAVQIVQERHPSASTRLSCVLWHLLHLSTDPPYIELS